MGWKERIHFAGTTHVPSANVLRVDGDALWDRYHATCRRIDALCGDDASTVFAEPTVKPGADETFAVAWFGVVDSEARPEESLDRGARGRVQADLTNRLAALRPALNDAEIGEAVAAMLNLPDAGSLLAAGERALLVNWGSLPPAAMATAEAFAAHTATTVGPFLPIDVSPRVPGKPWRNGGSSQAAGISPARRPAAAVLPAAVPVAATAVPVPPAVAAVRQSWAVPAALGFLSLVLAAALLYLLLPGVLIYPASAALPTDPAAHEAVRRQENQSLEEQIVRLQAALGTPACDLDPVALNLQLPGPTDAAPPSASIGGQGDAAPSSMPPADALGPAGTPPPAPAPRSGSLIDRLDAATVLVLAPRGDSLSTGSGFFITDHDVLTNRHVVEGAQSGIVVASKALGRPMRAELRFATANSEIGNADFALLHVAGAAGITPLPFATGVERLDAVIAAGFPASLMSMDETYRNIVEGDASQVPNLRLVATQGSVMALPQSGGARVISHSATISPGNSGGPLVDRCGRAVGVNTFIRVDDQSAQHLDFSLSAEEAVRFLLQHAVEPTVAADACAPAVAAGGGTP